MNKNKMNYYISILSSLFFLFIAFGSMDEEDGNEVSKKTNKEINKIKYFEAPKVQKDFETMRKSQHDKYLASQNDIKRSAAFNEANDYTKKFYKDNNGIIKDFTGKITTISTDQGGDYLTVVIKSKVHGLTVIYKTWNNAFSDTDDHSLIKKDSDVYNKVADLVEGDYVYFSATSIKNKERGIREISVSESGSLRAPEFIVRFTDIRKAE